MVYKSLLKSTLCINMVFIWNLCAKHGKFKYNIGFIVHS